MGNSVESPGGGIMRTTKNRARPPAALRYCGQRATSRTFRYILTLGGHNEHAML